MGRFIKSVEEVSEREITKFRRHSAGPITVRSAGEVTTATLADGRTVEVAANTRLDRTLDRDALRRGIEVHVDGRLVAHLRQDGQRLLRRSRRVLRLEPVEPGRYPAGTHFRVRSVGWTSLETPERRLVGYWGPTRIPRIADDVDGELLGIFAAVEHGFTEPIMAGSVWKGA